MSERSPDAAPHALRPAERRLVLRMYCGLLVFVVLSSAPVFIVYLPAPWYRAGWPWTWIVADAIVAGIILACIRAARRNISSVLAVFVGVLLLHRAAYGGMVLSARVLPGTPYAACFNVKWNKERWRTHELRLADPRSGAVQTLAFGRHLLDVPNADHLRLVGASSVLGTRIERIEAAVDCPATSRALR